ncbi:MAG: hypothetical protein HUK05_06860 [Prevotella sp.]|nr:hypothetical protein [Prevotella sp.]MCF0208605.1 hypothetical protein [Bacteroidaceae bacterium]
MKKVLFMLVAVFAAFTMTGCSDDDTPAASSAKATTLDAVINEDGSFNFKAEFEFDGGTFAYGNVYLSTSENITVKDFSAGEIDLQKGKTSYSKTVKNNNALIGQLFKSGTKVYYAACAKVYQHSGETTPVFGQVKSFIVP